MVNKEIKEKLYAKGLDAIKYYSKLENRFTGNPQLSTQIPRDIRINLIKVLMQELSNLPIIESDQGITLGVFPTWEIIGLVTLTTHDFNAGLLRGKGKGLALYKADCPYVDKWVPLVMYALKERHGLKYEDFWLKGNPLARILLGRELKDLTIKIKEEELVNLSRNRSYVISGIGHKLKRPKTGWVDEEQLTDEDEDRVDYNNRDNRIIRPNSTLLSVYNNDYPQKYGTFEDCLSKGLMSDLISHFIIKSK